MIKVLIKKLTNKETLSYSEMRGAMQALMTGETTDAQNAAFLTALAMKGETVEEILAAAEIMRELSTKVSVLNPNELVDPVGTGGTSSKVFNVSTASAIVASCAGVKIAKHGNRAASSKSGSADLLELAGVRLDLNSEQMADCVNSFGIGFMFAPQLHSAMRHVITARKEIAIRTVFNLLGPLTNPSGAKNQVLGVFSKDWLMPMAEVSKKLGQKRIMVINSEDGLDEISIAARTSVADLCNGVITEYSINPVDFGICYNSLDEIRVESAAESLNLIQSAFSGNAGAAYDIISLNSAAILMVSNVVDSFEKGVEKSREILNSGQANEKLQSYAKYTQTL